ncbi:putative LPS assembly protein LptD [Prevotella sp. 10(H)]|uniref:putative LPS assembly protein LptD n=1 Tax=Prevotella sp. 10(H) TaxID=1158294 RepID=UPI0004A786BD|nr:putative LPS assembly protein LptD [Prevotella sp. 10(H)]
MSKIRICTYIFLCILFSVPFLGAQYAYTKHRAFQSLYINDTLPRLKNDSLPMNDSLRLQSDSLPQDSTKQKNALDAIVDYSANDSVVLLSSNWGYLYGDAEVKYTEITLKGEKLSMNMDSSLLYATYGLDSIGEEFGYPIFSDGGTDYESKDMKYNFKTKKGYITNVITTQGEGYVIAGKAKKQEDNSFFMLDGKYTTCDDHEHPHFYLALTKAKVKPKKNVVTGPAYLVIEGLPLPLGLPFGFFPFSDKYSSGVIMPSYGDEMDRGFNLHDGGYYFAINDNIDLALTGDIYTKGSWGLKARSSYRKRYKYSGSFDINYLYNKYGEKDIDQTINKDLAINWTHSQDPKANMFRTLSASVNFATSSYNHNSLDNRYIPRGTSNTKGSSVSLTQRIPNSPWSFAATMNVAQRSQDSSISMTLPNLTVTMSRIAPFKRKEAAGSERWYEKIQMSYTGDFRNSIDTKENLLFKSNLKKDWNNAMKHYIPISATFSAFNYLNITPSINYTERWYTRKIQHQWNPETNSHRSMPGDTTYSFKRVYDFNAALSFQTKLYGEYVPIFSKTTRIRHVFTPSIGFSYAPDFSDPMFGFYERYKYYDSQGHEMEHVYSPYSQGMFGTAPMGASGMISFSFENNLEMKVASEKDSTGFKKISLIDNLSINFNHNLMADSLKWSDIAVNARFKFSKSFVVNIGAAFDPYMYGLDKYGNPTKVDKLRISHGKGIGKLKSTGYSISPSINQDTFKKLFGRDEGKDKKQGDSTSDTDDPDAEPGEQKRGSLMEKKKDDNQYDEDGYIKNEVKWNLAFNFSMNYSYGRFDYDEMEYKGRVTKNFGLSGSIQPTRNWNFNFNTSYDFDQKKIAYMSCNLTRNLHCWSITASFNPVGQYKSYYVSLRASSSLLQDLKYENRGRSSAYDPNWD